MALRPHKPPGRESLPPMLAFKALGAPDPHLSSLSSRAAAAAAESLQSCPTVCGPMDCSPPGSSVRGILRARILEWIAMPSSRGSSQLWDRTWVFCITVRFFTTEPQGSLPMLPSNIKYPPSGHRDQSAGFYNLHSYSPSPWAALF